MSITPIGVTERGDAGSDFAWMTWVAQGKPAVLITKNPASVAARLRGMQKRGQPINVLVHANITGYGTTKVEPNSPSPEKAMDGLRALVDILGAARVVHRCDPIICTPKGVARAIAVIVQAQAIAPIRCRISFFDQYTHVTARFREAGLPLPQTSFHAGYPERVQAFCAIRDVLGRDPELCAEPGFRDNNVPCVGPRDATILGVTVGESTGSQRPACGCVAEKHELLAEKHPCVLGCLYCYWKD